MQTLSRFNRERFEARRQLWTGYVTRLYLLYKATNVLVAAVQLYLLNMFLGSSYTFLGWGLFSDLLNGREWKESGHFPRVSVALGGSGGCS